MEPHTHQNSNPRRHGVTVSKQSLVQRKRPPGASCAPIAKTEGAKLHPNKKSYSRHKLHFGKLRVLHPDALGRAADSGEALEVTEVPAARPRASRPNSHSPKGKRSEWANLALATAHTYSAPCNQLKPHGDRHTLLCTSCSRKLIAIFGGAQSRFRLHPGAPLSTCTPSPCLNCRAG